MREYIASSINNRVYLIWLNIVTVIAIITFSISTIPNLTGVQLLTLKYIELATIGLFTVDYIARVVTNGVKYMKSPLGLIDLIAILPFYLSIGIDTRSVRIVRLIRLFQIFKMVRCTKSLSLIYRSYVLIKSELMVFAMLSMVVLFLSSVGIYYAEHVSQPDKFASIFHSMWWAVTTITTVGYGDMYPITILGKMFTFIVLIIGLGIIAIPTSLYSSALIQVRAEDKELSSS